MLKRSPSKLWKCRARTIQFDSPLIMGIVNVTPDSFYESSRVPTPETAVQRALEMYHCGAQILDLGGESTRPGGDPVSPQSECERLDAVIGQLRSLLPDALLSIDTRHTETAAFTIERGIDIINDVSGCAPEDGMIELVAHSGVGYVLTHGYGSADSGHLLTDTETCTAQVIHDLLNAAKRFEERGVAPEQLILDPGLGFSKTNAVSMRLLCDTAAFSALPYPVLIAASRKRFLGELVGQPDPKERGAASLGAAVAAVAAGANVVRVHDVRETRDVLKVFSLLRSDKEECHV